MRIVWFRDIFALAKKHRKRGLRGPPFGAKIVENRRRSAPKPLRGRFRKLRSWRRFARKRRNAPGAPKRKKRRKMGSKKGPKTKGWSPLFRSFFRPRSRPSPEGAPGRLLEGFWSILEQFLKVLGLFFSAFPRQNPREDLAKILHRSCTKPADALGNPTRTHKL